MCRTTLKDKCAQVQCDKIPHADNNTPPKRPSTSAKSLDKFACVTRTFPCRVTISKVQTRCTSISNHETIWLTFTQRVKNKLRAGNPRALLHPADTAHPSLSTSQRCHVVAAVLLSPQRSALCVQPLDPKLKRIRQTVATQLDIQPPVPLSSTSSHVGLTRTTSPHAARKAFSLAR